jgi:iduronate 2-sulfatase
MIKFIQAVLAGILISGCTSGISETEKYNVLFISIDDLRPELGCYGVDYVKSPAIDKLAEGGTLFTNAFCQLSHCAPSRSSIMTGLRPEECGVLDLKTHFREKVPEVVTLPQHFKNNGYLCYAFGKVYHNDLALQDSLSWSGECWFPPVEEPIYAYALPDNIIRQQSGKAVRSYPTEAADVPDNYYPDGMITDKVIEELHQLKNSGKLFFIAAGFYKPHLPFNAPKKYWDLYQPEEIPLSDIRNSPEGSPEYLFRKWSEPGSYYGVYQEEPFSDSLQLELKHGYLACVSYIDAQIHKIVQALDELNLKENTIIVIWGDHGFKLGEYGRWSKHSNLDVDTRVPLIIFHPGEKGKRENKLAELVDVYPTLVNLAGIPEVRHTNGVDLFSESAKGFAISQIEHEGFTGYSIRTSDYRYVIWFNREKTEITFRELYDLRTNSMELKNVADQKNLAGISKDLEEKLITTLDL